MSRQKHRLQVWLFLQLTRFANWLQRLPNRLVPPPFRLIQIGSAFWQSRALHAAAELDIATHLGDATLSAAELASRCASHPDATYRLLRMLAANGVFTESAPQQFRNNPLSDRLRRDHPECVRAMILMHNSGTMSRPWYEQMVPDLRTGQTPFESVHGTPLYQYMEQHPEFDALFAQAMASVDALTGDYFAQDFDWGQFHRVFDIGGSRGDKSIALLRHHPHLTAVVVDRPGVIAEAEAHWRQRQQAALLPRVQFQAQDLLVAIPPARDEKDIYLLSAVFHGLGEEEAVQVLRNLRQAAGTTGARVALMELMLPECGADPMAAAFDMQMWINTRGRERTDSEWQQLCAQGAWQLEEVVTWRPFGKLLVLNGVTHT